MNHYFIVGLHLSEKCFLREMLFPGYAFSGKYFFREMLFPVNAFSGKFDFHFPGYRDRILIFRDFSILFCIQSLNMIKIVVNSIEFLLKLGKIIKF
jgi:hypothetical protein